MQLYYECIKCGGHMEWEKVPTEPANATRVGVWVCYACKVKVHVRETWVVDPTIIVPAVHVAAYPF